MAGDGEWRGVHVHQAWSKHGMISFSGLATKSMERPLEQEIAQVCDCSSEITLSIANDTRRNHMTRRMRDEAGLKGNRSSSIIHKRHPIQEFLEERVEPWWLAEYRSCHCFANVSAGFHSIAFDLSLFHLLHPLPPRSRMEYFFFPSSGVIQAAAATILTASPL